VFVNEAGALAVLSHCSDARSAEDTRPHVSFPVVQDDDDGTFWSVLGAYDALVIVNGEGTMVTRFDHADFSEAGAAEIVRVVDELLTGP
jgi:hypothetical protein